MKTDRKTRSRAKSLRRNLTEAEWKIWHKLKNKQIFGLHFRKQHPIALYIADFACVKLKLIIEMDGDSHYTNDGQKRDKLRDEYLSQKGWDIWRFSNTDLYENFDGLLDEIYINLQKRMIEFGLPLEVGEVAPKGSEGVKS